MPTSSIKEVLEEIRQDLIDYFKIKGDILQLKATEKGSPVIAKSIYGAILGITGIIVINIALLAAIFALSLIFVEAGTTASDALTSLTFGSLCLLGLLAIIITILFALKDKTVSKMEQSLIDKVIDKQNEKDKQELVKHQTAIPATTTSPFCQTNEEEVL